MKLKIICRNRWTVVSPVTNGTDSSFESFFEQCQKAGGLNSSLSGIYLMMEAHSVHGSRHFNTSQTHCIDSKEKIYEYIKGSLRVFWFEDEGRIIVCTHGIVKKSQKTKKQDIDKALGVKKSYLESKKKNTIELIDEGEA